MSVIVGMKTPWKVVDGVFVVDDLQVATLEEAVGI
jgi:hypothetical protein